MAYTGIKSFGAFQRGENQTRTHNQDRKRACAPDVDRSSAGVFTSCAGEQGFAWKAGVIAQEDLRSCLASATSIVRTVQVFAQTRQAQKYGGYGYSQRIKRFYLGDVQGGSAAVSIVNLSKKEGTAAGFYKKTKHRRRRNQIRRILVTPAG
jgi:hypothetical protein